MGRDVARPRLPSMTNYMVMAGAIAGALFFVVWWILQGSGDEASWIPAALVATVVMLIAVAAREVVVRRAWTQYILEQDRRDPAAAKIKKHVSSSDGSRGGTPRIERFTATLRALQQQSAQANVANTPPAAHLDVYQACQQYLAHADEALGTGVGRSNSIASSNEARAMLRAGQERARALAKRHLLAWARLASRSLTHEAQRRALLADKIETAMRAVDVIDAALKIYPEEAELQSSSLAVQELITTVKVAHWVELAERAAFKGQYLKAVDRYRDALFYLSRGTLKEESRAEVAARIEREVELLRACQRTRKIVVDKPTGERKAK